MGYRAKVPTSFLLKVAVPGAVDISKTAGTRAGISLVGSPPPPPAGPAITSTVHGDPVTSTHKNELKLNY